MKKLILFIAVSLALGCYQDSISPGKGASQNYSGGSDIAGNGSGIGGSMARFNIVGNYMYVVSDNTLFTFSLDNPGEPALKRELEIEAFVETIFHLNGFLFLGTQNGVMIYSISNPASPSHTATYSHIVSCDPVVASGNWAYATLRTGTSCWRGVNQLDFINISNITAPSLHHSIDMSSPKGLGISGNKLYVCDADALKQFDISDPTITATVEETYALSGAYDLIPVGDLLIATAPSGISQYRIGADGSLTFLSRIDTE